MYVEGNPVNRTDPTGHTWCGFEEFNFVNCADFAERYVKRTALGHTIRDFLIHIQPLGLVFNAMDQIIHSVVITIAAMA